MLLNCFGMDGFNNSTYQVIRSLRQVGSYRGRLQSMHESLSSIPMLPYFRDLAIRWGRPLYAMNYGHVLAWIMTWDAQYSHRLGNWTPAFDCLNAATENAIFDFSDGASGDDLDDIISDTDDAVENLLGLGTMTGAFAADARAVRDLFEILKYPTGMPPLEGLIQDPVFMDTLMFREALHMVDINGVGADTYAWMPFLTAPDAAQAEVQVIRRGKGVPSAYDLAGMCKEVGAHIVAATGTAGQVGQVSVGASLDVTIYGAFRNSFGGLTYGNGDTNPGLAAAGRVDTPEDDSSITNFVTDGTTASIILDDMHQNVPHNQHQYYRILLPAVQRVEDYRMLLDTVDWEFLQPLSTMPQILRTQLAEAFGFAVG
jgi:hypothetical protein